MLLCKETWRKNLARLQMLKSFAKQCLLFWIFLEQNGKRYIFVSKYCSFKILDVSHQITEERHRFMTKDRVKDTAIDRSFINGTSHHHSITLYQSKTIYRFQNTVWKIIWFNSFVLYCKAPVSKVWVLRLINFDELHRRCALCFYEPKFFKTNHNKLKRNKLVFYLLSLFFYRLAMLWGSASISVFCFRFFSNSKSEKNFWKYFEMS